MFIFSCNGSSIHDNVSWLVGQLVSISFRIESLAESPLWQLPKFIISFNLSIDNFVKAQKIFVKQAISELWNFTGGSWWLFDEIWRYSGLHWCSTKKFLSKTLILRETVSHWKRFTTHFHTCGHTKKYIYFYKWLYTLSCLIFYSNIQKGSGRFKKVLNDSRRFKMEQVKQG